MSRILVVGIGNRARGDDAIGLVVAQELQRRNIHAVRIACDVQALWDVVDGTETPDLLAIIDAAAVGPELTCGSCRKFEFPCQSDWLQRSQWRNSHEVNLRLLLELAQRFDTLPRSVWIYAIGAQSFVDGESVSQELAAELPEITSRIHAELTGFRNFSELSPDESPVRPVA